MDHYFYLLAKEYKKQNRLNPEAELIVIGGASLIINYNFRNVTTDIDSIIRASSSMKDIINKVGDENNLMSGWLNDDFIKTASYSPKLIEYSKFYKKFCGCLTVRTITGEYLLAMKIRSARVYKHDLSDLVGIIKEQQELGQDVNLQIVQNAYSELYNETIPIEMQERLQAYFESEDLEELYYSIKDEERQNKEAALKAEKYCGEHVNEDNINNYIERFKATEPVVQESPVHLRKHGR
jgi:hypothetical protein